MTQIDANEIEVVDLVKEADEKAQQFLTANLDKLHELSEYLLEDAITGKQFMSTLESLVENTN